MESVKPGVVTVWSESHYHYTAEELTKEFEPCYCLIIDENLNVHYSEEETKAVKRFNQVVWPELQFQIFKNMRTIIYLLSIVLLFASCVEDNEKAEMQRFVNAHPIVLQPNWQK